MLGLVRKKIRILVK